MKKLICVINLYKIMGKIDKDKVTIYLPPELNAWLTKTSKRKRCSKSRYIRELIYKSKEDEERNGPS